MKFRDIWGRVQSTIARWNQSQPESGTSSADEPQVNPQVLRTIYGRFLHLNVGLNRHERRAMRAERNRLRKGFAKKDDPIVAGHRLNHLRAALESNTPNKPIRVYREDDGKNGIVKYAFINNPYFAPRVTT